MLEEPIEEAYFKWLYSKVAKVEVPTPSLTYWTLLRDLHSTEFVWVVAGDDNRAEEGLELRREFLWQIGESGSWTSLGSSVLEMLIALSRRAEFNTSWKARKWFWIFMENLGLDELNDAQQGITEQVSRVMDRFIWRTYRRDGFGGLFPLHHPEEFPEADQRKVELWYQFCYYVADHGIS